MSQVVAGETGLVAVGGGSVWTSPDGLNWSVVPDAPDIGAVTATRSGFVGVGTEKTTENACEAAGECTATVWTSPDGTTWNRVPHDEAVFGGGPDKQMMSDVTTVGDQLVAVGTSVWASADGLTWSRVYQDPALAGAYHGRIMNGVAAGPTSVLVVGGDGAHEWRYEDEDPSIRSWHSMQSAVVWIGTPSDPPG